MPTTLQISNWQKSKIRRMFGSNNSYFRIVAHNPNALKVRAITEAYNLHDEVLEDDMEDAEFIDAPQPDQPTAVIQPTLEVVVTDQQCTMTFNDEQVHICEEVKIPIPNPNPKLKIITMCKTENCVYTFSTYNINTFFTITINFTIR